MDPAGLVPAAHPHDYAQLERIVHTQRGTGEQEIGKFFITSSMCMPEDEVQKFIDINLARDLPRSYYRTPHTRTVSIVGSGPSLKAEAIETSDVWAINSAHDWLIKRGVIPKAMVLLDPQRAEMLRFVTKPHPDVTYYIAACCDPEIFERLKDHKIVMWNPMISARSWEKNPYENYITGGHTALTRAPNLAWSVGYREIHLHGCDSSFKATTHIDRNHDFGLDLKAAVVNGRTFATCGAFLSQVASMMEIIPTLKKNGVKFKVFGDGMMQHVLYEERII